MENQDVPAENTEKVLTIAKCEVHKFAQGEKKFVTSGSCELFTLKDSKSKQYEIKVKEFTDYFDISTAMVKIQYERTVGYLYENEEKGITGIVFKNNQEDLQNFCNLLDQIFKIYPFNSESLNPIFNTKIRESCPPNIENQDFSRDPQRKVKAVGKTIGGVFGSINGLTANPLKTIGNVVNNKSKKFASEKISEETRTKWKNVKAKSNNLNEAFSEKINPVVRGYYHLSDKVGQKVYASENIIIKTMRDYSIAFAKAMSEAELASRYGSEEPQSKEAEQQMKDENTDANLK